MKIKSSTMDKVFVTCNTIFLVLFVTITLYPVLNTVALSFNDGIDAVRGGIHLWPRIFTLSNYKTVLHHFFVTSRRSCTSDSCMVQSCREKGICI